MKNNALYLLSRKKRECWSIHHLSQRKHKTAKYAAKLRLNAGLDCKFPDTLYS